MDENFSMFFLHKLQENLQSFKRFHQKVVGRNFGIFQEKCGSSSKLFMMFQVSRHEVVDIRFVGFRVSCFVCVIISHYSYFIHSVIAHTQKRDEE